MRDDLARKTYEIVLHGLRLRDRYASGDRPLLGPEQARLKSLLGADGAAAPWGRGGDAMHSVGSDSDFAGIRYALTCWLDEILIDAGWREWDEDKLENALYRQNVRASQFWHQARLAETLPNPSEALEAFLVCALLGFRGNLAEAPDQLREWANATRARVTRSMGREPAPLPERAPVSDVPPLTAVEGYRRMTQRLVFAVLLAVPVVAFFLVVSLGYTR